jgi:hypothetical protein
MVTVPGVVSGSHLYDYTTHPAACQLAMNSWHRVACLHKPMAAGWIIANLDRQGKQAGERLMVLVLLGQNAAKQIARHVIALAVGDLDDMRV